MNQQIPNTLIDFFDTPLTADQQSAVSALQAFLEDPSPCFLLKGYAGTGKTFLMAGLVKYLASQERPFRLMAPTGRAAKILTQKTGYQAGTIHRGIYALDQLKELPAQSEADGDGFKFYYDLRLNQEPAGTVYIVDEASMVSNKYNEAEFFRFGSGHLLHDLFRYISFSAGARHKIIFVGDTAQLPPVDSSISPALSAARLQTDFKFTPAAYELTQVVRQKSESGILDNATQIREAIRQDIYNRLEIKTATPDVSAVAPADLLSRYLEAAENKISATTMIIAYSNRIVYDYNRVIRQHFFPNQPQISPGDKILLVQNNYAHAIELFNGDFGRVIKAAERTESRTIPVTKTTRVELVFRDAVIRFWDINNRPQDVACKIIENLLNSKERELSSEETKALYIDFKIRYPKLIPGTKDFKDTLKTDPWFNALRIKYGYAVTCHKAQGGEWPHVFVDFDASMGKLNEIYFRWVYTAITRAAKQLYLVNEPHFGLGSQLIDPGATVPAQADKTIIIETIPEEEISFEFPEDRPFLKKIYGAVRQGLQGQAIEINQVNHLQYCERYYFSKGDETIWFGLWYNQNQRLTRFELQPNTAGNALQDQLIGLLAPLKDKALVYRASNPLPIAGPEVDFPPEKPYLRDLFDAVSRKLIGANIYVAGVTHHPYLEKYSFKQGEFTAQIDIYYNKKGQFTRAIPQKSTSVELLNHVMQLINEVH